MYWYAKALADVYSSPSDFNKSSCGCKNSNLHATSCMPRPEACVLPGQWQCLVLRKILTLWDAPLHFIAFHPRITHQNSFVAPCVFVEMKADCPMTELDLGSFFKAVKLTSEWHETLYRQYHDVYPTLRLKNKNVVLQAWAGIYFTAQLVVHLHWSPATCLDNCDFSRGAVLSAKSVPMPVSTPTVPWVSGLSLEPQRVFVTLEEVAEDRMLAKLRAIMDNVLHPLHKSLDKLATDSFNPRCLKKQHRKLFLPSAISFYNAHPKTCKPLKIFFYCTICSTYNSSITQHFFLFTWIMLMYVVFCCYFINYTVLYCFYICCF